MLLSGVLQGLLAIELFRISWMLTFGWRRFFLNGGKVRAESKSCVRRRLLDPCLKATIKAFFSISDELVCATFTLTLNLTLSLTLMLAFFSISGEFVRYHRRRVLTVYNSLYISRDRRCVASLTSTTPAHATSPSPSQPRHEHRSAPSKPRSCSLPAAPQRLTSLLASLIAL